MDMIWLEADSKEYPFAELTMPARCPVLKAVNLGVMLFHLIQGVLS